MIVGGFFLSSHSLYALVMVELVNLVDILFYSFVSYNFFYMHLFPVDNFYVGCT